MSQLTKNAARAVAYAMGDDCYAIVGGAACTMLGSARVTMDVDFVVPQGQTKLARNKLRDHSAFQVEVRTNHTSYVEAGANTVGIEILAPPGMFRDQFSASTPYVLVDNVRVLKPTLLLNAKCGSILGRSSDLKKRSDAEDIKFLLSYISSSGMSVESDVPKATDELIAWFSGQYGGKELFEKAGFAVPNSMYLFVDVFPSRDSATKLTSSPFHISCNFFRRNHL
ncbi:hypothetical protein CkaCkLH20_04569 [Colletotrichum karsti]|uniref:Uncharacterized protein n=1 Tax=Colletotrichum karsti TaxID=1095194 RepID=A0A9P6LLP0_9PEZI|nr:uncharacterized protein CkaCkLH20_04569 [Colletotrichum karsti]KAF9877993.1 hypothetical protein CkaCkLH20_04569 [Colletotrichum karsti]